MRVSLKVPAMLFGLTVLWVALWDDLSLANVVTGVIVAVMVIWASRLRPASRPGTHFHPIRSVHYVLVLLFKLIESNLRLAWEILTPGIGTHTGIIAVPMRTGSNGVVTLVANSITLTPGTMTIEVERDGDQITLYVHGMYTRDLEKVRHELLELEALAIQAFGTPDEAEEAARTLREHVVDDSAQTSDGGRES